MEVRDQINDQQIRVSKGNKRISLFTPVLI